MLFLSARLLTAAGILSLASATCQLSNMYHGGNVDGVYKSDKLCLPQPAGDWTFSLYTEAGEVPDFSTGSPNAGYSGDSLYLIYDNDCNLKSAYPTQSSCSIPFTIEENFLRDVLIITAEDTGVGSGYFSFNYGNGKYSIGNNHCGCQDMSSGLVGATGCKCAFPVDGVI